jgi:hypothetical protein
LEKAQTDQIEAELKLDLMRLMKESRLWQSYMQNLRMFNAESHQDKIEQQEVSRQRSGIDKLKRFQSRVAAGAAAKMQFPLQLVSTPKVFLIRSCSATSTASPVSISSAASRTAR